MKANGTSVKQGKYRFNHTAYLPNGTSKVTPLSDWLPIPESIKVYFHNGNYTAITDWNMRQIAEFNAKQ